jgi:hypothetical protein
VGPKVRNDIQYLTKRQKSKIGYRCVTWGKKKELHAAHKGSSRKEIIERVLQRHKLASRPGLVRVDLESVRQEILKEHKPLEKHIDLVCEDCHRKSHASAQR